MIYPNAPLKKYLKPWQQLSFSRELENKVGAAF